MIDISLGGMIGAIVGTIVAAVAYGSIASAVENWFASRRSPEEPRMSSQELAVLRRSVLAVDLLVFGGLGYVIGDQFVG